MRNWVLFLVLAFSIHTMGQHGLARKSQPAHPNPIGEIVTQIKSLKEEDRYEEVKKHIDPTNAQSKALLIKLLTDNDKSVREMASFVLQDHYPKSNNLIKILIELLDDKNQFVKKTALKSLNQDLKFGRVEPKQLEPAIDKLSQFRNFENPEDRFENVADYAIRILTRMDPTDPRIYANLVHFTKSKNSFERAHAVEALGGLNAKRFPDLLQTLVGFAKDKDSYTRRNAAKGLGRLALKNSKTAISTLDQLTHDKEAQVRSAARAAMVEAYPENPKTLDAYIRSLAEKRISSLKLGLGLIRAGTHSPNKLRDLWLAHAKKYPENVNVWNLLLQLDKKDDVLIRTAFTNRIQKETKDDDFDDSRIIALQGLVKMNYSPKTTQFLLSLTKDDHSRLRAELANQLEAIAKKAPKSAFREIQKTLFALSKDTDVWVRANAARALSKPCFRNNPQTLITLKRIMLSNTKNKQQYDRRVAADIIRQMVFDGIIDLNEMKKLKTTLEYRLEDMNEKNPDVQVEAARALLKLQPSHKQALKILMNQASVSRPDPTFKGVPSIVALAEVLANNESMHTQILPYLSVDKRNRVRYHMGKIKWSAYWQENPSQKPWKREYFLENNTTLSTVPRNCTDSRATALLIQFFLESRPFGFLTLQNTQETMAREALPKLKQIVEKCVELNENFLLHRLFPQFFPSSNDLYSINKLRGLIEMIDPAEFNFEEFGILRTRLHGKPSKDDTRVAERLLKKLEATGKAPPKLINQVKEIITRLKRLYNEGGLDKEVLDRLQVVPNEGGLKEKVASLLKSGPNRSDRLRHLLNTLELFRKQYKMVKPKDRHQAILAYNNILTAAFTTSRNAVHKASQITDSSKRRQSLKALVPSLIKQLYFEGYLDQNSKITYERQWNANESPTKAREILKNILSSAQIKVDRLFAKPEAFLAQFRKDASLFRPNLLRASAFLSLSEIKAELDQEKSDIAYVQGETFGRLRLIERPTKKLITRDTDLLIFLNGVIPPNDIGNFAGVASNSVLEEASHVLFEARRLRLPSAYDKSLSADKLRKLNGKPVKMIVDKDGVKFEAASEEDLTRQKIKQTAKKKLIPPTSVHIDKVIDLTDPDILDDPKLVQAIGTKAKNVAELYHLLGRKQVRDSMAIPFHYYKRFLNQSHDGRTVAERIEKTLEAVKDEKDPAAVEKKLVALREAIIATPLDLKDLREISESLQVKFGKHVRLRHRSSANAEDLPGFMAPGAYTSVSANSWQVRTLDGKRSMEKALKTVWASLWNYRAYEARRRSHVDHQASAMGILVHESFRREELANGVGLIRKDGTDLILEFSTQMGEISVTNPDLKEVEKLGYKKGYIPKSERLIIRLSPNAKPNIQRIRNSNLTKNGRVLLDADIKSLIAGSIKIFKHFEKVYGRAFPQDIEFKIVDEAKLKSARKGSDFDRNTLAFTRLRTGRRVIFKQARPFQTANSGR